MKNNPFHVYWGQKNGVVVTRTPQEEGGRPEVVFTSNTISLDQIKKAGAILLAGLFLFWRISRAVSKAKKRRAERKS